MSRMYALGAIAFIFLLSSPLSAQDGFAEADSDDDAQVSSSELKAYVSGKIQEFDRFDELMAELDADKNGWLSKAEFGNRMQAIQSIQKRPKPDPTDPDVSGGDSDHKKDEATPSKKKVVEFAEQYDLSFVKRNPKLGSVVEDVLAYDENGDDFELSSTKGKYTVIVFGCLT